ncbi:MAG: hypothetical protein V7679_00170 [Parasphingorhabdus sp.]
MIGDGEGEERDVLHQKSSRTSGWSRSHLPVKQVLDGPGVALRIIYRYNDLYQRVGEEALEDRRSDSQRAGNRIPNEVRAQVLETALEASGCASAQVLHKPRLLSDNRPN